MTTGVGVPTFPDAWHEHEQAYTRWMRAGGCSEGTVRLRRHYLARFSSAAPDPIAATTDDLAGVLSCPTWSAETRRSARAAARSFFGWMARDGRRPDDPSLNLPRVRMAPPRPRPASTEALDDALAHADHRVRLMLLLAAYAGLRCSEIARLHSDDVYQGEIRVKGKGGRVRYVPLHPRLAECLRVTSGGWLFPNGQGSHVSAGHVTRLLSIALGPGTTAHQLRHLFACRAYASQRDILAVRELLGHASVATTQRYTRTPDDALRRAVEAIA